MTIAHVNGIDIYFEIHGSGPPLVLIMGLRRNAEWWWRQIPELSKHFTVIAFDNRGAGRSDKPETDYSIRLFADDTAGLMEFLNIPRAHILGISMGGYIAQEFAINYPDKVNGLILGCTSCGGNRAVSMSEDRIEKFQAIEGLTPEQILRNNMDLYFSDRFVREHPETDRRIRRNFPPLLSAGACFYAAIQRLPEARHGGPGPRHIRANTDHDRG